jgi:hypothetical protein
MEEASSGWLSLDGSFHVVSDTEITISHLIPLYKSSRFFDIIIANIKELARPTSEIILADRNGDTEFCTAVRRQVEGLPNIRVICDHSDANWVENIAGLIEFARGKYLQILPHDDSTSRIAVDLLCAALDEAPDAVLTYGRVRAFDLAGIPVPKRDELNANEDPGATRWTLDDALPLFWTGRFAGAFKGVIRTAAAQDPKHLFKATPTTVFSERTWLFSLALAGRFVFVPTDILHKRYYADSTHRTWQTTPNAFEEAAHLMAEILRNTLENPEMRDYAIRDVISNAAWRIHSLQNPKDGHFTYQPLPHPRQPREHQLAWGQSYETT